MSEMQNTFTFCDNAHLLTQNWSINYLQGFVNGISASTPLFARVCSKFGSNDATDPAPPDVLLGNANFMCGNNGVFVLKVYENFAGKCYLISFHWRTLICSCCSPLQTFHIQSLKFLSLFKDLSHFLLIYSNNSDENQIAFLQSTCDWM